MKPLKPLLILACILYGTAVFSQRVYPLVTNVQVDSVMQVQSNPTKITYDPLSGHLFYSTYGGNIYEVFMPGTGNPSDTLRYTSADHGITTLQGMIIEDSTMYLCGNVWSSITGIGKIMKGILQPNGTRVWSTVATSAPYPSSEPGGDHGFAGITIDPSGNFLFVSSGARTHLGEIRTNSGAWPGKREVPMTTRLLKIPVSASGVILPNDSAALDASGYIYAKGIRNTYSMAWNADGNLFGIDNSGERDDPEELNWLRSGRHYGYPWRMGGHYNPLMNSPYDVNQDLLVNHNSFGYMNGWFADNPGFPGVPAGLTFTDPIRNYGPDADFYKDSVTGTIKNASDNSSFISSFTSHRSPLGLVIDKDSLLASPYRGDAFMLSFMPGGDSTGYTPMSPWGGPCPYVDPVRDLLHIKMTYNSSIDNYTMNVYRIAEGFYLPVDAVMVSNTLYVIENSGSGDIWKITMPHHSNLEQFDLMSEMKIFPNPSGGIAEFDFYSPKPVELQFSLFDAQGREVISSVEYSFGTGNNTIKADLSSFAEGIYIFRIKTDDTVSTGKIIKAGS